MFFGSPIFGNSPQNINYKMLILGEELMSIDDSVERAIDVTNNFPLWLNSRNSAGSGNLIPFTQAYYDWLYDKGGYELSTATFNTVGLRRLLDLDETPVEFLKHFTYTFVPNFPEWYIGATAGPNGTDTGPKIRRFIKNIRQGLYQRKSTEEAYEYFFSTLFDSSDIKIDYPKKNILRLNGGRFEELDWGINIIPGGGGTGSYYPGDVPNVCDEDTPCPAGYNCIPDPDTGEGACVSNNLPYMHRSLGGSYLNGPYKLQDSYWYQDYSYLLKTGVDVVDIDTGLPVYYDVLQSILHPVGIKGFYERTEQDYIPPDDFEGGFNLCESPRLQNYFPYRMLSGGDFGQCVGCSGGATFAGYQGPTMMGLGFEGGSAGTEGTVGWTYGDAWATQGPGSISLPGPQGAGFEKPTFVYPHWADGICGDSAHSVPFGEIYIGDFIYLCPIERSPNIGITGCTAYSDTNAGPCWS